jgi:hypothetical protein
MNDDDVFIVILIFILLTAILQEPIVMLPICIVGE